MIIKSATEIAYNIYTVLYAFKIYKMKQNEYYAEKQIRNATDEDEKRDAEEMMERAIEENRFSDGIRDEIDSIEDAWS